MPLAPADLHTVFAGIRQLHTYVTTDAIGTVTGSGYFSPLTDRLKQFDTILVISSTGATPVVDVIFITSATGAATVTTSAVEGVTAS
jgi:hypothetical protein